SQNYYWAIDGDKKSLSGWETFYPDGLAQLFPILYGILQDRAGKELLWNKFHEAHGDLIPNLPVAQKIIYQWTKEVMENEN
ncbi:MAG: hypothetical protein GY940_25300, partial [bacterium]|nr:hypothetical protein [bacterium]